MITCHDAVKQLWEYLDHTVDEVDRARVEEHLSRCRRCCAEMEFAEELRRVLAQGSAVELPPDVRTRLHRTIEGLEI